MKGLCLFLMLAHFTGAGFAESKKDEYSGIGPRSEVLRKIRVELTDIRRILESQNDLLAEKKADKAESSEKIRELEERIARIKKALSEKENELEVEKKKLYAEFSSNVDLKKIVQQIRNLDLGQTLKDLSTDAQVLSLQLQALERRLDQLPVGVYLREKLAGLLSSQVFCDVAASCERRNKISRDEISDRLGEVFFGPKGNLGRPRSGKIPNKTNHEK